MIFEILIVEWPKKKEIIHKKQYSLINCQELSKWRMTIILEDMKIDKRNKKEDTESKRQKKNDVLKYCQIHFWREKEKREKRETLSKFTLSYLSLLVTDINQYKSITVWSEPCELYNDFPAWKIIILIVLEVLHIRERSRLDTWKDRYYL